MWKETQFFKEYGNFHAKASIIIPVRGIDVNIENNVKSLLSQDYPDEYEVIYVVDKGDSVKNILTKYNVKIVITDYYCEKCSGKIKAQITGLKYAKGDVIVFGDSDTYYPRYWLKELVSPLGEYMASTTFSFAKPFKITLRNLIRAGFWTLAFESQAVGGTFLWGGSMAFKKDFFTSYVIDELSNEWCDDCTLTRIVKRRGGKIAFVGRAEPLNVYDERNLIKWAKRQVITVRVYSPKGAKAYLLFGPLMFIILLSFIFTLNIVFITPFILWIIKNIIRMRKKDSILPALMSVIGIFFAWIVLVISWRENKIVWRDNVYNINLS
ncbi:glycosyltransferase [Acidianus brierleyi]|uniref:Glycosyl transferase family 2 n=1 Tax=Acidianus brierleyi TaxID=41673 RepID=A0A2U9IB81_9CREN|nr:glycosyltransferase family 2 protein [Acidianus brierleyi]AWR93254.1 glycosyltransferase [Acidianus brierleyi]